MLDAAVAVALDQHNRDSIAACGSRWAVCQTHPQAERWALTNLHRQGYRAYLPLATTWRKDRATPSLRHRVETPLWPGYVFVAPGANWAPIRSTFGVARLLMAGEKPHMLASGVLEAVEAALSAALHTLPGQGPIAVGEAVVVSKGAACGMVGAVIGVHGETARIGLMMFGHIREVFMPIASLERRECPHD